MATVDSDKPTIDTQSWRDLLNWVNGKVKNGNYTKVEELSSGCAYCEITKSLLPKPIGAIKIKTPANTKDEKRSNLKLLNNMLQRLDSNMPVPIEKILNSNFKDNFYYLQWFKKFYDSRAAALNEMKMRCEKSIQPKPEDIPKEREVVQKEMVATVAPTIPNILPIRRTELLTSIYEQSHLNELFGMNFMADENGSIDAFEDTTRSYTINSAYAVYEITVKKTWDAEKNMVTISTSAVIHNK